MLSTTPVTAAAERISTYAIPMALNNVAAAGAEPVGVMLAVLLPEETEESGLQLMMDPASAGAGGCPCPSAAACAAAASAAAASAAAL